MPRIRTIKPSFWADEKVACPEPEALVGKGFVVTQAYTGTTTKDGPRANLEQVRNTGGLTTHTTNEESAMAVTKRTRFEVLRRDNYTCRYCRSSENELTVDHVIPVALGGSDSPDNIVAACRDCNLGKASSGPDEHFVAEVSDEAIRWADAMKAALRSQSLLIKAHKRYHSDFTKIWNGWTNRGEPLPLPENWRNSLDRWNEMGVTKDILEWAVTKAMEKPGMRNGDVFRYAAGIIWRTLEDAQAKAGGVRG